jgi:CRISPR-associated protein Cst2
MTQIKGLTATILFESSAINGDASVGIQSIKKLSRDNGVYSYISRPSLRNKAFTTLDYLAGWEEAPLTFDEDVIQFRFPEANIVQYPEMDIFGFMNTAVCGSDKISVTRKAPVGMTKAISLEPYRSDTAFYANHSLVRRANNQNFSQPDNKVKKANPNPYTREEHYSLYRFSYTIDLCRLGFHEVTIIASDDPKNAKKQQAYQDIKDWVESFDETKFDKIDICPLCKLTVPGENMQWYRLPNNNDNKETAGYVGAFEINKGKDLLLSFVLNKQEREKRLKDLLKVITGGLVSHSRTEEYGVNPIFIAMATLTIPMPIFHSCIKWNGTGLDETPLNNLVNSNSYIEKAWYRDNLNLCPGIRKKQENSTKYYEELTDLKNVIKEIS